MRDLATDRDHFRNGARTHLDVVVEQKDIIRA
jgi:hypothetical protein